MPQGSKPAYGTAVFLGSTAFVFLNFGLPIRADDLGMSAVAIGGMYTVFTGTMLLVRPLVGYYLDRVGRRWFFTSAFFFYSIAMGVFAGSSDEMDFYLARFLQGIGASLMWVSARTIVADTNDQSSRGVAMGRLTTTSVRGSMMGAFYGFTLLGFMPLPLAWVWAFCGYALMAGAALIWSLLRVEETWVRQESSNTNEGLLVGVSGFMSPDLRRVFVVVLLSAFASALIEPIYLLYLKNKFAVGMQGLALAFLPAGIVFAVLPRYSGQWSDRWGRAPVIAIGVLFAGLVSLALPFWPNLALVSVSYILFSVGWAMASPAEDALVADLAPAHLRGTVMGSKEAAAGIGAALGPLAGGYIYEYISPTTTFVLNGSLLLLTSLLAWFWFRRFNR
ncbi:MAG: MFS transporter [Gammaproteobacteria bacterium]|nr:MFS transporter [Gammaproteobacteria bacterium]